MNAQQESIQQYMRKHRIPEDGKGFYLLAKAIELCADGRSYEEAVDTLAFQCQSTAEKIEKTMMHAAAIAWEDADETTVFANKRLTPEAFIALAVQAITE